MDRVINKIYKELRFYKEEKSRIQLRIFSDRNISIKGIVIKTFPLFHPYAIVELDSGNNMKIYLENIMEDSILPSEIDIKPSYNRKSIPKSLRKELWNNYFGDRYKGKCYVCKNRIFKKDFECGHVKAYINGGETSIPNLRPICKTCNRSMGTQNLEDFKQQYH